MMFVLSFLGVVFFGLLSYWYYEFLKHRPYLSKFNGPWPLPIVGNIYGIYSNKDIIPVVMNHLNKHGPVIRLWFGFRPRILVADYKMAETLLHSTINIEKSEDYRFIKPWLGTGLITSSGDKWKRHRKLLAPAFYQQHCERYIKIFNEQSDVLVKKLHDLGNNGAVDVYPLISLCSLDIISEAVMGVQLHAQTQKNSTYVDTVTKLTKIVFGRTCSLIKSFDCLYAFTKDYKEEQRYLHILRKHINFVITSRKEIRKDSVVKGACNTTTTSLVDLLLENVGADVTLEDIREEVDSFMFAGHDTSSTAICFTLYCLALHSDVQNKAYHEIKSSLQNGGDKNPTYFHLQEMKYLEMVIKESLRLYPPVPLVGRTVVEDSDFGGVTVPKGANVSIFTYGLLRQKESFPNPEKFDPERFNHDNVVKHPAFSYIPFSAGLRNCIGQRFAMIEMKTVLAQILLNFEISAVPGFEVILTLDSLLRSTNGIVLNIKPRATRTGGQ